MRLEIDQDGGVHLAATQRQIIDTEDAWGGCQRENGATKQAEQCIGTDEETGSASKTRSCLAAGRLGEIEEQGLRIHCATGMGQERRPEALGKGAARTHLVVAAEAAHGEGELDRASTPGQINRVAAIAVVDPCTGGATGGTAPASRRPVRIEND